jgi:hypothetical protein
MSVTVTQAQQLANELDVDFEVIPLEEWRRGIEVELEHTSDLRQAAQIARDHLRERADYYTRLALVEGGLITLNATLKTQWIRAADVFLIGPLMVAGGVALSRTNRPLWGTLLGAFGLATIAFNARNWWLVHQATRRTP